ncbi:G_PROTEIN_RECEP_F1_2 domain-containing protein [Caenorhabditis elegans]|uniref:G_PROTEIN_RECEP_F1_2 domain-containing protein n=1 Tax=Caenorhabditis elegans TaxID=6239 RepID=Q565A7_CAEEL|nr:G_PROTEIN_RECEP_F1_2 domain-containing protein [Caenorhabditis elegans]CAI79144.1 G_PROTEIN_RECEP_F1_2 domain-containing protein [Caenorhabditis elegans]|eukprot:NP_001023095.1 Uncharacterized protein CELE_C53D6.11 [Caenorhabditis elegans]
MSPEFFIYIFLGLIELCVSTFILSTVLNNFRLREKYSIFVVKFIVDIVVACLLLLLAYFDRNTDERICGATLVISTSIPLLQVLLLLCEVIDWSLAAFSPVYFHHSSLLSRIMPFIVGAVCYAIILTALLVIDATSLTVSCITSPEASAVTSAYDFSLAITTVCVVALALLLHRNLNSAYFRPVMLHFIATLFLEEVPLLTCILLKYSNSKSAILAADITNWLVCIHSLLHSAYFVYNHQDYREAVRNLFRKWKIVKSGSL